MHAQPNRAAAAVASALLTAAAVAAIGACGAQATPEVTPSAATDKVKNLLLLDDEATACVGQGFDANPSAAAALNVDPGNTPSPGQIDTLKELLRTCITPQAEAELFVTISKTAYPSMTDADVACIRAAVLGLTPAEQDTLLVGGLALTLEGLSMGRLLTEKLVAPCNLQRLLPSDGAPGVAPGAGQTGSGSSVPPAASATMITRG